MNEQNNDTRLVRRELLRFACGELLCFALVCAGFAAFGRWSGKVLLGAAVGAGLAALNYFLTAMAVFRAADKAVQGAPQAGSRLVTISTVGRFALMIGVLVLAGKSGKCDVVAMVIPLLAARLLLFGLELLRRKDG